MIYPNGQREKDYAFIKYIFIGIKKQFKTA